MGDFIAKRKLQDRYQVTGFISSGTYGRVYKARGIIKPNREANINGNEGDYAIKKFKPDKEGEHTYTGISQSAIREMALCAELRHENIIEHVETILQDKSIFMVFGYCEHDLLQLIHYHSQLPRQVIPAFTVRSVMYQLLQGCQYLHENWVMHRDLKPANIMVNSAGQVKIGDLGLARIFREPLIPLTKTDKVVVTIWYRAPELLLGAQHYTAAVDLWAVGCIFAELISLRPIFKGEEAKMDKQKNIPFQKQQVQKIVEVLGMPDIRRWPKLEAHSEYSQLATLLPSGTRSTRSIGIAGWYARMMETMQYSTNSSPGNAGLAMLCALLEYDPEKRLTAEIALKNPYFHMDGQLLIKNCFEGSPVQYPRRKITKDEDGLIGGAKRSAIPLEPVTGRPTKKFKDG